MRQCGYCGKEYADTVARCVFDGEPLVGTEQAKEIEAGDGLTAPVSSASTRLVPRGLLPSRLPKLLLAAWGFWIFILFISISPRLLDRGVPSPFDLMNWGVWLGSLSIPVVGLYLAWDLYRQPTGKLALWFAIVCLVLHWKFIFGPLAFTIYGSKITMSFHEAVGVWWHSSTKTFIGGLANIIPIILLPVSLVYWPLFWPLHFLTVPEKKC